MILENLSTTKLHRLERKSHLLFKGATLVSPHHNWLSGDLLIHNSKILKISEIIEAKDLPPDTLCLDASEFLITPGFVNAHTHVAMNIFRDLSHQTKNMIYDLFFPWESQLDPQILAALSYPYILSGLKSGVTAFADHYYFEEGIIPAFNLFGVKAFIGETTADLGSAFPDPQKWKRVKEIIENWPYDTQYFVPVVAPHATDTNSKELLVEMAKFAKMNSLSLHMHLSQTQKERDTVLNRYGLTPVQLAEVCGVLGPKCLAVHLVSASEHDLKLIKDTGTVFGFSPASEIIYEQLPNLKKILELEIPFALGTDCAASNDSANILSEMRLAHLLCQQQGFKNGVTEKILNSVTYNAANVLGAPHWSNLSEGSDADIVVFKKTLDTLPTQVPQENLIFSHSNQNVHHVLIRGKWVLFNQQPVNVDLITLEKEFKLALKSFKAKLSV